MQSTRKYQNGCLPNDCGSLPKRISKHVCLVIVLEIIFSFVPLNVLDSETKSLNITMKCVIKNEATQEFINTAIPSTCFVWFSHYRSMASFSFLFKIRTYWLAAIVTITVLFWSSEVSVSFERIFIQRHNFLIENGIPSPHKGFVHKLVIVVEVIFSTRNFDSLYNRFIHVFHGIFRGIACGSRGIGAHSQRGSPASFNI